jgi:mono/diheme cytochrome c family protein
MNFKAVIPLAALGVALLGSPAHAQETKGSGQAAFVVDKGLAKTGKTVWSAKGCMGCHMIGKKLAAPDLNGLYERRTAEWVKSWLKNPEPMFETDAAVQAMVKEYNGLKMPNMKLTDAQIDQVMHYIASEQKAKKK